MRTNRNITWRDRRRVFCWIHAADCRIFEYPTQIPWSHRYRWLIFWIACSSRLSSDSRGSNRCCPGLPWRIGSFSKKKSRPRNRRWWSWRPMGTRCCLQWRTVRRLGSSIQLLPRNDTPYAPIWVNEGRLCADCCIYTRLGDTQPQSCYALQRNRPQWRTNHCTGCTRFKINILAA